MNELIEGFKFKKAHAITLKGLDYVVLTCEDFHGYPVTVGFVTETDRYEDGSGDIMLAVKAAVCSPEDTFDPDLGTEIVLGRLMKIQQYDKALYCKDIDKVDVYDFVGEEFQKSIIRLAKYLKIKDESYSYIENMKHSINTDLAKEFEEFK